MSANPDEAILLNEFYSGMSIEELELLNDTDETLLEEREAALSGIRAHLAAQAVNTEVQRNYMLILHQRYDAIERNVKALRRRRERINCRLSDGSRIFDLEVI